MLLALTVSPPAAAVVSSVVSAASHCFASGRRQWQYRLAALRGSVAARPSLFDVVTQFELVKLEQGGISCAVSLFRP